MVMGALAGSMIGIAALRPFAEQVVWGKSAPSPPPAPDPAATAAAQAQANKEAVEASARVNAVDIDSPYGQTTYEKTPVIYDDDGSVKSGGIPTKQITTLTDQGQRILDTQQNVTESLSNTAATKVGQIPLDTFSTSGLPYDPRGYTQPLLADWQGYNGPFSPDGPEAVGRTNQLSQSASAFGLQANAAQGRANANNALAAAPLGVAQSIDQNSATYQQNARNLPYDPRSYGNLNQYRGDVESAFFNRQSSLLQPQFQQQREALEQDLADRGIPIGGEAYNDAMGNLERNHLDAQQRIANDAVLAGGAEAQRQLGMELGVNQQGFDQGFQTYGALQADQQRALGALGQGFAQSDQANLNAFGIASQANQRDFDNVLNQTGYEQGLRATGRQEALQDYQTNQGTTLNRVQAEQNLRNTALNEDILQRTQALNEASAIIQGAPALGVPQPPPIPSYNVGAPDVQGAVQNAYNAQLNAYNAQQASRGSVLGSAFGLIGSLIPAFSHSSLKTDFEPVEGFLDMLADLRVSFWRYTDEAQADLGVDGERHVGPMAEDWKAATGLGNGITINGIDAVGVLVGAVNELRAKVEELTEQLEELKA